jgi:hypothetical protein
MFDSHTTKLFYSYLLKQVTRRLRHALYVIVLAKFACTRQPEGGGISLNGSNAPPHRTSYRHKQGEA